MSWSTSGAVNSGFNTGGQIGFGGISLAGVLDYDSHYSFNLGANIIAGQTTNAPNTNIGMAVSIDTTAPTQVKLCAPGDILLGRLETVEQRQVEGISVGTVITEGGITLPMDPLVTAVQNTTAAQGAAGTTLQFTVNATWLSGVLAGQPVTGTNIAANTTVASVDVVGGTVSLSLATTAAVASGTAITFVGAVLPAIGDSVQGGVTPGTVVKLAAAQGRTNVVVSTDTTAMTAVVLFL